MSKIRRICLCAGPCCGKSTLAAEIFARLKERGYDVEHVQEYVKGWTFIGRKPKSFDQMYIFAKQLHKEDVPLRSGIQVIVTECPLFLSACYAKKYKAPGAEHLIAMNDDVERKYPSINFVIDRKNMPYNKVGRFQDLKGAKEMDKIIVGMMDKYNIPYQVVGYNQKAKLLKSCLKALGMEKVTKKPSKKTRKRKS